MSAYLTVLWLKSRFPVAKSPFKKSIVFLGSVIIMVCFLTSWSIAEERLIKSFNSKKLMCFLEVESNLELLSLIVN